jgi:dihydroxyacetone kinase
MSTNNISDVRGGGGGHEVAGSTVSKGNFVTRFFTQAKPSAALEKSMENTPRKTILCGLFKYRCVFTLMAGFILQFCFGTMYALYVICIVT